MIVKKIGIEFLTIALNWQLQVAKKNKYEFERKGKTLKMSSAAEEIGKYFIKEISV